MKSPLAPLFQRGGSEQRGFTLIELLITLAIATLIMAALSGVIGQTLQAETATRERNDLTQQARFAMERMVNSVRKTMRLMLPFADNPGTAQDESLRDVLAVTLDPTLDRNADGYMDADNDNDGLIDEDLSADATNDGEDGIVGIDDDNDGGIDEGNSFDDDEDGDRWEDPRNGIDDDGDGSVGEDSDEDMNMDGYAGVQNVDDDGDGSVDEGHWSDDDEDGARDEDWLDPVVYFLNGTTLMERMPNLNPIDGKDYSEYPVAENVSNFSVQRLVPTSSDSAVLVEITLELTGTSTGALISLSTRVRVGGGT